MRDYDTYMEFARECRRLAERASDQDKATLLKIAEAWEAQAKAAAASGNGPKDAADPK